MLLLGNHFICGRVHPISEAGTDLLIPTAQLIASDFLREKNNKRLRIFAAQKNKVSAKEVWVARIHILKRLARFPRNSRSHRKIIYGTIP